METHPPRINNALPGYNYELRRVAMSMPEAKGPRAGATSFVFKPAPAYHPTGCGASRDTWIYSPTAATAGQHLATDEQLYWQSKLSKPEHRGKGAKSGQGALRRSAMKTAAAAGTSAASVTLGNGKPAVTLAPGADKAAAFAAVANSKRSPRVPQVAEAQKYALPPIPLSARTVSQKTEKANERAHRDLCDKLADELLAGHKEKQKRKN